MYFRAKLCTSLLNAMSCAIDNVVAQDRDNIIDARLLLDIKLERHIGATSSDARNLTFDS
jgi:hypothetical protein